MVQFNQYETCSAQTFTHSRHVSAGSAEGRPTGNRTSEPALETPQQLRPSSYSPLLSRSQHIRWNISHFWQHKAHHASRDGPGSATHTTVGAVASDSSPTQTTVAVPRVNATTAGVSSLESLALEDRKVEIVRRSSAWRSSASIRARCLQ